MAEPTNTDALHQGNESTEEMQLKRGCPPGPEAELLVEQRGPLLGRCGLVYPRVAQTSRSVYPFLSCINLSKLEILSSCEKLTSIKPLLKWSQQIITEKFHSLYP